MRFIYGGYVDSETADSFLVEPNIDGFLVTEEWPVPKFTDVEGIFNHAWHEKPPFDYDSNTTTTMINK